MLFTLLFGRSLLFPWTAVSIGLTCTVGHPSADNQLEDASPLFLPLLIPTVGLNSLNLPAAVKSYMVATNAHSVCVLYKGFHISPMLLSFISFSLPQITLLQPHRGVVMVKKKYLQRPINNTVYNVDMGVFNLSFSLCLYLSSSVSLCLCFPVFMSTIINHL